MLSLLTHKTIAILSDISNGKIPLCTPKDDFSLEQFHELLNKLVSANLICPVAGRTGYELSRPANEITLLDILYATNEHLNCNHEIHEEMYLYYRSAANRLGVINSVTRSYLSEIKLTDF